MNRRWRRSLLLPVIALAVASAAFSGPIVIGFEGLSDSTFVTTQFSGVTFSNAIVLTSGVSLNELDFPPFGGVNVVSDSGGPMTIVFATPVLSFFGYFTYALPVTVQGFDGSNALLSSATSLFSNNTLTGGAVGSSANEIIQLTSATGFSKIVLTGDPGGGSFVLDDVTYAAGQSSALPEPSTVSLALMGAFILWLAGRKHHGRVRRV